MLVVSELVRGGCLDDLVREHGPLPVAWVARVVAQLADALAAVHASGAVHRDLSAANVLLMPSPPGHPETRLADFGQAAPIGTRPIPHPLTPHPQGTAGFVAPEAGGTNDPAQDLWSLGAVAVHLVTGQPPSVPPLVQSGPQPGHRTALDAWHRDLDLTPMGALEPLTRWLLQPDPTVRPTAAVARSAARALLGDLPAEGPAVPDRLRPPAALRHWAALALLLGLTLAALAVAWTRIGVGGGP